MAASGICWRSPTLAGWPSRNSWAGEFRTVDIIKGTHTFHPVSHLRTATEFCSQQMQQIAHFDRPDPDALAERLSVLLSDMNETHPFREGNGRTQRFVIGRLAAQHGHPIAWRAIGPVQNLELSIASRSDPLAFARPLRTAMTAARGFGGSSTRGPDT